MCHFLAPAGQPEMMHKNFMRRHLRISVARCSGMKFFAHFQLNTPQIKPLVSLRNQRLFSFPKKFLKFFHSFAQGVKNEPSRCLPIEEILLLCLERGEFLKKCGNFAGKFSKGKVMSEYTQSMIQTERDL